jgi:hypothetical protein
MNYNLAVKLGIGTRAGHHVHAAVDVRDIYVAGSLALTNHCLSQSLYCRENRRIVVPIATVVITKIDGHNFKCCLSVHVHNYTIIVPTKCTSFY